MLSRAARAGVTMVAALAAAPPASGQLERSVLLATRAAGAAEWSAAAGHPTVAAAVAGPVGLEHMAELGWHTWTLGGGAPAFVLPASASGARMAATVRPAGAPYEDAEESVAGVRTLVPDRASLLLLAVGALGLWTLVARRVRLYLWYLR